MRVLFASSEIHPLAKTGGLADVSEALPLALAELGIDIQLIMQGYPSAVDQVVDKHVTAVLHDVLGFENVRLVQARMPKTGLPVWLIDCPALFKREGGPYQDPKGNEWQDNAVRFAMLNHVAAKLSLGTTPIKWRPDVAHANDWHTGLLPALLAGKKAERPATIFTIHNMAYQGLFSAEVLEQIGCDTDGLDPNCLEFFGKILFLKAGIHFGDHLTTVSPTYAREIMTPEFGYGLDGLLQKRNRDVSGILNGVDYGIWDPRHDPILPDRYDPDDMSGKQTCKRSLQKAYGLDIDHDRPIIAFISRITHQKMADCVLEVLPWIESQGAQIILVAEGENDLESGFLQAAQHLPQVAVQVGYDEPSAHRLLAGADILLAPSRFEPCGLTHLYAMRYGTIPVVRCTGGLADTVIDGTASAHGDAGATGYVFQECTTRDMMTALKAALDAFRYPLLWRHTMLNAVTADFGWEDSAKRYLALYQKLSGQTIFDSATEEEKDIRV